MAELNSQNPSPTAPSTESAPDSSHWNDAQGTEELAHLAKMSGTGSTFGAADYVAINTTAVASLILGFAGALSLLLTLFLILPFAGIICGLLAIRQIRRSNGTQGGFAFAIGGIVVCLLFGGIVVARDTNNWLTERAQSRQSAAVVAKFGDEIKAGHYENAYDGLTAEGFRARVSFENFKSVLESLQNTPGLGRIESIEWNHLPMEIEHLPDDEIRVTLLTMIQFHDLKEPSREYFRISERDGDWKVSSIPRIFPEKKPGKAKGL